MKNNNFKQFLAMLLCITIIPVAPFVHADEDFLVNKGEVISGLNFGGGARPTEFSSNATQPRSQSLASANKRNADSKEKTPANLGDRDLPSLAWLTPNVLSKAKEKEKSAEEKKAEVMEASSSKFSLQSEAKKGSQLLNAFKMNISTLLGVIRNEKEEKPGFDLDKSATFADDSKSSNDKFSDDEKLDLELEKEFLAIAEIADEKLSDKDFMILAKDDNEGAKQEEKEVPLDSTEKNVIDALVDNGSLPENHEDLLMPGNFVSAPANEITAEAVAVEMVTENQIEIDITIENPGEEGHWEERWVDKEVIDPAVQAQIDALESEMADLNNQKDEAQSELDQLLTEIEDLNNQITALEGRIATLQNLIDQLNEQLDRIQQSIDDIQDRIDDKQRDYNFLEFQWNGLLNRNIALDQMARALWAELFGFPRPNAARRDEIRAERRAMQREFNDNVRDMNRLRNEGLRIARAIRDLEARKARMEATKARIQERLDRAQINMNRLQDQKARLDEQLRLKEARRDELEGHIADINNRIAEIQRELEELRKHLYMTIQVLERFWVPGTGGGNDSESEEEEPRLEDPSTDHSLVEQELTIDVKEPHSV